MVNHARPIRRTSSGSARVVARTAQDGEPTIGSAPSRPLPSPGLLVGRSTDPEEAAADRIADSVLRRLRRPGVEGEHSLATARTQDPGVRTPAVRRTAEGTPTVGIGPEGGALDGNSMDLLRSARGRGSGLPQQVLRRMEGAFDADLSGVRIHTDRDATELNRTMSAKAFTHGRDVFFRDGVEALQDDHLVAHELAHVVGTSGHQPVRRALDPQAVLAAVDGVPELKAILDSQTDGQRRQSPGTPVGPQKAVHENVRIRVLKILRQQKQMFGSDDAMSMALAIDTVAQAMAEELYDTSLKPAIARHLLEHFRGELRAGMTQKGHRAKDLKKATAIVSTDALGRYMHGERRLMDAAWDIKDEALKAKMAPADLFELLQQKFQSQLASYSFGTVDAQQDKALGFNQSEITGALSKNYLKELFGNAIEASPAALMPKDATGGGLQFDAGAQQRLTDLEQAVQAASQEGAKDPRPTDAKGRRERLFKDVKENDQAIRADRESQVKAALQAAPWGLSDGEAKRLISKLKSRLPDLPLTVTHEAARRLPADVSAEMGKDKSAAGIKQSVTVAGKQFDSPGKWTKGDNRGDGYLRFRTWKDRMMTGNLGMDGEEMPTYGAVNPHFRRAQGTGEQIGDVFASSAERRKRSGAWTEKDDNEHEQAQKFLKKDWGKNYYGDLHLVLRREKVAERVLYTASDHGVTHADPFLTFADFLLGSRGDYQADQTKLKRPGAGGFKDKSALSAPHRATEIVQPEFAASIVASVLGSKKSIGWTLPFEMQIHGGVDWDTDVKEIWVSTATQDDVLKRLQDWSKAKGGRPTIKRAKPPAGDEQTLSTPEDMMSSAKKRARQRFS